MYRYHITIKIDHMIKSNKVTSNDTNNKSNLNGVFK